MVLDYRLAISRVIARAHPNRPLISESRLQKHPPKRTRLPPVEIEGKPRPEDVEINKFLAIYNKTGNYLALWSALGVCLPHRRRVPDGLAEYFEGFVEKLLKFSADD